jgi:hypothetical protein
MTEQEFKWGDPRRLLALWKQLTGEDLFSEPKPPVKKEAKQK